MATVQIGMRIDEDLLKEVDEMAERLGLTRTDVLERCISLGLSASQDIEQMNSVMLELLHTMTKPRFRKVIGAVAERAGYELDPAKLKMIEDARSSRKKKAGKPAKE